ncbi:hypothetical protein [Staphylococcus aureus]|uniref:hypothetical protein n=1 Tax=Staphylococcus aureus TaxID=1280 RepID=UPI0004480ECB|nr:hypothetical protein [Staphylococcus aureus]EZT88933.1 hypothetical protein U922_02312 [Staphylococcus aureus 11S01420]EZV01133.1 hypothetical protein U921_02553 [Staphylococcus aureus 11S01415]HDA1764837.1 hypothetical protein [Staphylococcus aureus]
MKHLNMIESVNTLLKSNIETSKITQETGISKGYMTNLRNGNRDISKASFEVVEKLYLYYLEQKDYIEASKDIDQEVLDIKIPKDVQTFILSLNKCIEDINSPYSNVGIEKIFIERFFNMSKDKKSNNTVSYLLVNDLVPLEMKKEVISYQLKFSSPINKNDLLIEQISNYNIEFAQNDLELMLKQLIYKGAKVKLIKSNLNYSDSYNTGIYIATHQDEIFKYENSFLNISINDKSIEEES